MSKSVFRSAIAALALMSCAAASQAAVYHVQFDGNAWDFDATVTTDAADNATAITGVMTGPGSVSYAITNLTPAGTAPYSSLWSWNNKFYATTPNVDWYGLLWQTAGGYTANFYFDNGAYVLSVANIGSGNYANYANGVIAQPTVTPIPIPASGLFLATGLAGLTIGRRRTLALQSRNI